MQIDQFSSIKCHHEIPPTPEVWFTMKKPFCTNRGYLHFTITGFTGFLLHASLSLSLSVSQSRGHFSRQVCWKSAVSKTEWAARTHMTLGSGRKGGERHGPGGDFCVKTVSPPMMYACAYVSGALKCVRAANA